MFSVLYIPPILLGWSIGVISGLDNTKDCAYSCSIFRQSYLVLICNFLGALSDYVLSSIYCVRCVKCVCVRCVKCVACRVFLMQFYYIDFFINLYRIPLRSKVRM